MTQKRPMDAKRLVQMARDFAREYQETHLISLCTRCEKPSVHVDHVALSEIASPDMWMWEERDRPGGDPWRAITTVDGVEFIALFTDAEKAEALGETADQPADQPDKEATQ